MFESTMDKDLGFSSRKLGSDVSVICGLQIYLDKVECNELRCRKQLRSHTFIEIFCGRMKMFVV